MGRTDTQSRLKQWLASGKARLQPLTFSQRELWETSPVDPGDPANNICSFFEIKGPVTFEQMKSAVGKVVERQEGMRTSILPGKQRPLQIIRSEGETVLRYRELSAAEARPAALEAIMEECFREPFDLLRGPLYRMDMLRRGPDDHAVVFTIHHAVGDGWTLGAFIDDLFTAYVLGVRESGKALGELRGVRDALSPLPMTYSDWGAAERARWQPSEIADHAQFWKKKLAGSRFLWDRSGAVESASEPLQKWVTALPEDQAAAVRVLARQSGATIFSTLLSAFQFALYRWTGVDDIVVGTPVANRTKASVRETMGYFSGVVPLRCKIDPEQSFLERLRVVQEEAMDAFAHAMPFAELAIALGEPSSPGQHTVFDTRFAFQNHPMPDIELPGISTKVRTISTGTARFDLACELTEDSDEFEVVWIHRPSVISVADVRALDGLFLEVLTSAGRQLKTSPAGIRA
ncbi:MAG: condensation domain-containing protein [Verrucomicrobiales bacterium]